MPAPNTPRCMVKALVRGEVLVRPLLMPLMFSLGARLENLPLREFQSNPTRIANALRQIRSALKVDGLTCYFDPLLEATALGCCRTQNADGVNALEQPSFSDIDDLRQKLKPSESLANSGFIPVACEVLRRLKVMLKDEPALMVVVTGPLALAAQLSGNRIEANAALARELAEFAAEVTLSVSTAFVEAGADVVVLREDSFTAMSRETVTAWAGSLQPIINIIRFYEALPLLLLDSARISAENLALVMEGPQDCVCVPTQGLASAGAPGSKQRLTGVALPVSVLAGEQGDGRTLSETFASLTSGQTIALVTSSTDVPATADLKQVARVLEELRERLFGL